MILQGKKNASPQKTSRSCRITKPLSIEVQPWISSKFCMTATLFPIAEESTCLMRDSPYNVKTLGCQTDHHEIGILLQKNPLFESRIKSALSLTRQDPAAF